MFCSNCGTQLQDNAKFCHNCGQVMQPTQSGNVEVDQANLHQLPLGTVLRGRYRVEKVLGQGGFGITYLGLDTLMETQVAIKEFYPSGVVYRDCSQTMFVRCISQQTEAHFQASKARFLREAKALVKFKHIPEVVDILDFLEENNTAYIVMEYVQGMSLAKYVSAKGGRLTVEETFTILKPVMQALAEVHKGGIVHRDIAPDNIILHPMGGAKLLDFGAVRALESNDADSPLAKSTEAILKHGFAPIEQYNTRGSLGPWTDEYAMCATIYYCLTGKVPEEASIRISEETELGWNTIPGLSARQAAALERGMALRARDRFPDLDRLLSALFDVDAEIPDQPVPGAIPASRAVQPQSVPRSAAQPASSRTGKKTRQHISLLAVFIGLILLGAAACVGLMYVEYGPEAFALDDTHDAGSIAAEVFPSVKGGILADDAVSIGEVYTLPMGATMLVQKGQQERVLFDTPSVVEGYWETIKNYRIGRIYPSSEETFWREYGEEPWVVLNFWSDINGGDSLIIQATEDGKVVIGQGDEEMGCFLEEEPGALYAHICGYIPQDEYFSLAKEVLYDGVKITGYGMMETLDWTVEGDPLPKTYDVYPTEADVEKLRQQVLVNDDSYVGNGIGAYEVILHLYDEENMWYCFRASDTGVAQIYSRGVTYIFYGNTEFYQLLSSFLP